MSLQYVKHVRKPLHVISVRVTEVNLLEAAQWCGGTVEKIYNKGVVQGRYVKVNVKNPGNIKQTRAFVGDWILKAGGGFKVYTSKALSDSFDEDKTPIEPPTQTSEVPSPQ